MKFLKILSVVLLFSICEAQAVVNIKRNETEGFSEIYYKTGNVDTRVHKYFAIAHPSFFPLGSLNQGSIFQDIFEDMMEEKNVLISIENVIKNKAQYEQDIEKMKAGCVSYGTQCFSLIAGMYYDADKYSKLTYIYPSFFENKVHVITARGADIEIKTKEDFDKHKGVYAKEDNFSKFVMNEMKSKGVEEVETYRDAAEQLLTGKVDFILASYYPSQIAFYKMGLRDYIVYSKESAWNMPMFIAVTVEEARNPDLKKLKSYFSSFRYKKRRDKAFEDLIEFYKNSTKNIVPPTFVNQNIEEKTTEDVKEQE